MSLSRYRLTVVCGLLVVCTGCLDPWNTRFPSFVNGPPEAERIEQQFHDPYPDAQLGPATGFRPTGYDDQRSLPVRIREKSDGSRVRGSSGQFIPPPISTPPGSQYPAIVPF